MLPLTQRQSRLRRSALIATGLASVAVLAAATLVPIWNADAGGLERGEANRPPLRSDPKGKRGEPRVSHREVGRESTGQSARPVPVGDVPVAVPLPPDRARGVPLLPSQRPTLPVRTPLPPLPPPDPQLVEAPSAGGAQIAQLRALFRRPEPRNASPARELIALGARLFAETKLSADHRMSCATCHDPAQAFADNRRKARGNKGQDLPRNTPALWNLAEARAFYWDGRAPTLEAQIKDAVERDGEMDATLDAAVVWLKRDPSYVEAFARVFSARDAITNDSILTALATYERTLVSPATRFDRWVDGDQYALTERELSGFRLFTGKGRCLACHGGWRFTDDLFHDVGLRSKDPGRQAIDAGAPERAFKTPSLREARWTAPYMHDGSLKSFDEVVAHYAGKLDKRASLAPELKRGIELSDAERADLVAFLTVLSSEQAPRARDP